MVSLSFLFVLIYSALIGFSNGIFLDEPNDRPVVELTIQFTASYPPQIAPTSTVYGAIVTNILKVVDCNYVQVENLNHYVPPEGQFSFRTTVPVLTRYHVTCMDPSTVITRLAQDVVVATAVPEAVEQSHAIIDLQHKNKRSADETASSDMLLGVAERLSAGIDPSNENLTVREFRYLREINTALFSMNIVNSGLPLKSMCQYLQDPSIENNLEGNYIDSKQAANIICFASVYGLYLGQSNDKILSDLAALEYAVQMHAYHSEALLQVCKTLSYSAAQMLGIDADGIQMYVCNGTAGIDPTSTSSAPNVIMTTGTSETSPSHSFPTAPGSDVYTFGSGSTIESWTPLYPTSIPSSFLSTAASITAAHSDTWNATETATTDTVQGTDSSIIFGTGGSVFSSATSAAGTVAPWFTETGATPVPTVIPSSIVGSEQAVSTTGATRVASFYVPPRLVRDRLRRHG